MSELDPEKEAREFEDFLAGRDKIAAAYKEAVRDTNETAPPELDAAILQQAKAAVAPPLRRRPGWVGPLALAATLLLSLSVLLNIWRAPQTREMMSPDAAVLPAGVVLNEETLLPQAPPAEPIIKKESHIGAGGSRTAVSAHRKQGLEAALSEELEPASAPQKASPVAPGAKTKARDADSPAATATVESEIAPSSLSEAVPAPLHKKAEFPSQSDSMVGKIEHRIKDEAHSQALYAEEKERQQGAFERDNRRQANQGRLDNRRTQEQMRAEQSAPPNALPPGFAAAAPEMHDDAAGASSAPPSGAPMSSPMAQAAPENSVEAGVERIRGAMSAGDVDDALGLIDDFRKKFSQERLPEDVLSFERAYRSD